MNDLDSAGDGRHELPHLLELLVRCLVEHQHDLAKVFHLRKLLDDLRHGRSLELGIQGGKNERDRAGPREVQQFPLEPLQ